MLMKRSAVRFFLCEEDQICIQFGPVVTGDDALDALDGVVSLCRGWWGCGDFFPVQFGEKRFLVQLY